jgi:hypothetical protein
VPTQGDGYWAATAYFSRDGAEPEIACLYDGQFVVVMTEYVLWKYGGSASDDVFQMYMNNLHITVTETGEIVHPLDDKYISGKLIKRFMAQYVDPGYMVDYQAVKEALNAGHEVWIITGDWVWKYMYALGALDENGECQYLFNRTFLHYSMTGTTIHWAEYNPRYGILNQDGTFLSDENTMVPCTRVRLISPNGTAYELTVADDGTLSAKAVN